MGVTRSHDTTISSACYVREGETADSGIELQRASNARRTDTHRKLVVSRRIRPKNVWECDRVVDANRLSLFNSRTDESSKQDGLLYDSTGDIFALSRAIGASLSNQQLDRTRRSGKRGTSRRETGLTLSASRSDSRCLSHAVLCCPTEGVKQ